MRMNQSSQDSLTARELEILRLMALGLSNHDISEELTIAAETVRWYTKQIYSKLGVHGRVPALVRAKELGLLDAQTPSAAKTDSPIPLSLQHNLPVPTTPFIGRGHAIAEILRLLDKSRLVTLTGVGGTGKTRLALRVAEESLGAFSDGVYFVDLAPVSAELVVKAIAAILSVSENSNESLTDTLKRALRGRQLLLLIDNFEHVLEAAPLVSDLLGIAPGLKVLVTSRETLHLTGEQEYTVPPLSLPSADATSIDDVVASEAVILFVQRAQLTLPRFAIVSHNAPAVAQICARLDGLPLAIEMAAARSKLLTPQALLERLESRLTTLTGGSRDAPLRQRTLRDTLEWSHNLLDEDERILFARLSVFRGGCSLEAIEVVCGNDLPIDVLDALSSLVDKNLVQQKETAQGEPRFGMLETIHEYARERLEAGDQAEAIRRRHAEYFTRLTERAQPELWLAQQKYWFQTLDMEFDNLRAVWEWSLGAGDVGYGIRSVSSMESYWHAYGRHTEGLRWVQRLLPRLNEVPLTHHASFLSTAGRLNVYTDRETAVDLCRQAVTHARKSPEKLQLAWAITNLAVVLPAEPEVETLCAEALSLFRELNHRPGIGRVFNTLGNYAHLNGDDARAIRAIEDSVSIAEQTGNLRLLYIALYNQAFIALQQGDHEQALRLLRRSLVLCLDQGVLTEAATALHALAGALGAGGEPLRAARLFGASEALLERHGTLLEPDDQLEHDRIVAAIRAQLGQADFEAAWGEGHQMSFDAAVQDALR